MKNDLIKFSFLKEYKPENGERFTDYLIRQKIGIFEENISLYGTISEYQSINNGEMWDYERVSPIQSGLAVDIFVDGGGSYKIRHHPKWIYFRNSYDDSCYEFLPLLIDKYPRIPAINVSLNISHQDLNDIKRYILKNYHQLSQMADGKGARLISLNEINNRVLSEMANLKKDQSGMNIGFWIDDAMHYVNGGHAKRLKFDPNNGNDDSNYFPSIVLCNLKLEDTHKQKPKYKLVKYAKKFTELNRDLLDKVADKIITYDEFLSQMILLKGSNVNIFVNYLTEKDITNKNYMEVLPEKLGKSFGWTLIKLDNKYNFINSQNEHYSKQWYDEAEIFKKYSDGTIATKIRQNDKEFLLYLNRND
jgi:hypothetical protein